MLAHHAQIPFETLRRDKARYDALDGPVPASYLQTIGVDFKILQRCVAIDRNEYCDADPLTSFPPEYERCSHSGTRRIPFPEYITTPYHALALLLGEAARAADTRFTMTWPNIKSISVPAGTEPKLELKTCRPVLYCNGTVVPNLGEGEWDTPSSDAIIEFKSTDAIPFIEATKTYYLAGSSLAHFLDPGLAFGKKCAPTPEQRALYSPLLMILDAYDPALAVDSLRGYFGNWYSEVGFLEYEGEAASILYHLAADATFNDILDVFNNVFYVPGPWGIGNYEKIPVIIAQEIFNIRQLYRGEVPFEFAPIELPVLDELPRMVGLGVE